MPDKSSNAFKEEMVACIPDIRAFARSLTGRAAQADDLVQETLLKAWSARDRFEAGTNMRAWLFTILRNTFYSGRRKAGREVEDPEGTISGRLAVPADHIHKLELHEFRRALLSLPVDQREALILISASGFSHEEAARIMGCAVGTIKSRVARARRTLEAMVEDDELPDLHPQGSAQSAFDDVIEEGRVIAGDD